jgi:hypothetical protein
MQKTQTKVKSLKLFFRNHYFGYNKGLFLENSALRRQHTTFNSRLGGLKGGKARAEKLTPAKGTAIGKKAAKARWGNKKK